MTVKRMRFLQQLLKFVGLDGRLHLEWISSAEAQKFARVVTEFTERIKALGPNPLAEFNERIEAMGPRAIAGLESRYESPLTHLSLLPLPTPGYLTYSATTYRAYFLSQANRLSNFVSVRWRAST